MKLNIKLKDWDYTCADGCCSDYGTELWINGERITEYANDEHTLISSLLDYLKIEYNIEF